MLVTVAVVAMLFAIVMPAVKQAQMRALQARQVSAFGMTSNTPAGAMELPQMESLTLSSSVDPIGNPTDSLDEISANLQMVYACSRWRIAPGPHQLALILSDGAGKPLTDAKYKFVARETEWRTWHRMNLGGINPRPAEFIVTVYLDGKEMGTRRVAGGTQ